jgi:hypothetical protein
MSPRFDTAALRRDWARWLARAVALGWGAFWTWFCVASAISELPEGGPAFMMAHLFEAAIVLVAVGLACKSDLWGGIALVATALLSLLAFRPHGWQVPLLLAGPPLVSGVLLLGSLAYRHRARFCRPSGIGA